MEKKNINLLQQRGAPPTFWEKLYDWVTNSARIIVIVVEVLVLVAFGWRFYLDRNLKNINEDIEDYGVSLKNLEEDEKEIRIYQSKMRTYNQLWNASSNLYPVLKEVNSYIPSSTKELSVSLNNNSSGRYLTISGELVNNSEIDKLENSLKSKEEYFREVTVNIDTSSEGDYSFRISALIIFSEGREPLNENGTSES